MAAITEQTRINTSTRLVANDVRSAIQPSSTTLIDDALAHTGPYFALTALLDSTIVHATSTTNIIDGADFILKEGMTIYGKFDIITLGAGGSVMAYTL